MSAQLDSLVQNNPVFDPTARTSNSQHSDIIRLAT
jgi:hypothetical protein